MKRSLLRLVVIALPLAAALVVAGCNGESTDDTVDISGVWTNTNDTGPNAGEAWVMFLAQDGSDIMNGEGDPAALSGTVSGNSFTIRTHGLADPIVLSGTVDGDTMEGTYTLQGGQSGTFHGTRRS